MYERFFGFRERPFELTVDPRFVVFTQGQLEALSNLEYGIESRKGICLLLGPAGCGKTTVIRAALDRQPAPVHCVHLQNPALTRPEFVEMLASKFGLSDRAAQSKTVLLRELESLLRARLGTGETSVLMVDDAQSLPLELLEELRLLTNMEVDDVKLLSVVLVGQPELARRIEDPSMSQLKQRIALWCEIGPLSGQETVSYVLDRIRRAGGTAREIFTIEAVQTIHQAARGVPRIVNVLADNALISGLALNQRPVTRDTVLSVCRDFRLDVRAEATAADAGGQGVPRMEMPRREPVVPVRVPLNGPEPFAEIEGPARRRFSPAGGDA